jgi:hypothetical protein
MARGARATASVFLTILVLLEGTPSFAAAAGRSHARRCEIASSITPITFLALPSDRTRSAIDPRRSERIPIGIFAIGARGPWATRPAGRLVRHVDESAARRAWFNLHRQRARSPNDPDPL